MAFNKSKNIKGYDASYWRVNGISWQGRSEVLVKLNLYKDATYAAGESASPMATENHYIVIDKKNLLEKNFIAAAYVKLKEQIDFFKDAIDI